GFLDLIDKAYQEEFRPVSIRALYQKTGGAAGSPLQPRVKQQPNAAVPFFLEALARYQVLERDDWLAALEDGQLGPAQVMQVRRSAYETLLCLADDVTRRREDHRSGQELAAEERARLVLVYLSKAEAAFRPTSAFYRIRAACRSWLTEMAARRADEELARNTSEVIALDHYLLAQAATNKEEAGKQYEAALRVEPGHYWSLLGLGKCLLKFGKDEHDYVNAVAAFTGCIMKRPDHAQAYELRATAHDYLNRPEEARADYSRTIELDPRRVDAWAGRGW